MPPELPGNLSGNLVVFHICGGTIDFLLELIAGFFKFPHALTETTGEFRELLCPEEQEHQSADHKHFGTTKGTECEKERNIHGRRS